MDCNKVEMGFLGEEGGCEDCAEGQELSPKYIKGCPHHVGLPVDPLGIDGRSAAWVYSPSWPRESDGCEVEVRYQLDGTESKSSNVEMEPFIIARSAPR